MTYPEFKARYALTPDPQQEAAILRAEGPTLLLAVPGSGKTTTLVTRLGYLIHCLGVEPGRILTVTYTVAAAGDMKRRFAALFGEEHAGALAFRTINGICQSIISYYAWAKGAEPFALWTNEGELNALVRWLMQSHGAEWPGEQEVKEVRTRITCCKNGMLRDEEVRAIEMDGVDFPAVYFGYREYLERNRRMDYDDQMVFALRILRRYPDILAHFQSKYPYLCVDEAQDTSKIQHAILRLLAGQNGNLFLVGDEDQSIYGFRAAYPQALTQFESIYPGAKVLYLEQNYRSTRPIVAAAQKFIEQNKNRRPKHMKAVRGEGPALKEIWVQDRSAQYRYLAQVAQDCKEETAILYRDNDSALPLIDLLERQGIPYRCRQVDSGFFTHWVVRDIVDILTLAQDPWDGDAFLRVYYKLGAGISRAAAEQAAAQCGPDTSPILELVASLPGTSPWTRRQCKALQTHMANLLTQRADRGVYRIVHFMGYGDYLEQRGMDQSKTQILEALGANEPTPGGLLERLEVLRELVRAGSSQNDCPFILSTIHSSKGLEYKRVILMDVADGLLPKTLPGPDASSQDLDAYEEERRLFYVGMTRAKEELWVMRFRRSELTSRFASSLFPKSKEEAKKAVPLSPRAVPDLVAIEQTSRRCVPGAALCHRSFGPGQVVSRSGDIILVRFADGVERRFSLSAALRLGQFQLADSEE